MSGSVGIPVLAGGEHVNVPTPFGKALHIEICGDQIVACNWIARTRKTTPIDPMPTQLAQETTRQLLAYMKRQIAVFDLPLALYGTGFELEVWHAVMQIPFGARVSYAEVARAIDRPRAYRGVARAMSNAPFDLLIPAHRVVGSDGTIRGADATSMRARLLAFEAGNRAGRVPRGASRIV